MVGRSNIELLMVYPQAMKRFCDALAARATVCELEDEIRKLSDSMQTQISATLVCNLDASNLLQHYRNKKHERLHIFATSVGTERGKRLGRERAKQLISEERTFGVLQDQQFALVKPGVTLNEDD